MSSPSSSAASEFHTPCSSATHSESEQPMRQAPQSSIEHDPNNPPPETAPTSQQPTRRAPQSSIEHDPNNPPPETAPTSGQPTRRAPLSSIEHDPENPPPETPPVQNERKEPVDKEVTSQLKRINLQRPVWKRHFEFFRCQIWTATIIAILAISICIVGYIMDMKILFLGIASGLAAVCFSFIWLTIGSEPPIKSDKYGKEIEPAYRIAKKKDHDSMETMLRVLSIADRASAERIAEAERQRAAGIAEAERQRAAGIAESSEMQRAAGIVESSEMQRAAGIVESSESQSASGISEPSESQSAMESGSSSSFAKS